MLTRLKPLVSRYFRQSPSLLYRTCSSSSSRSRDEVYRELVEPDTEMTDLVDRYCYVPSMQQQVLVIQPFIRYGCADAGTFMEWIHQGLDLMLLSLAFLCHKDTALGTFLFYLYGMSVIRIDLF